MSQMEKLPLVGYIEIAQRAGVQRNVVTMWRTRDPGFPKPVVELRVGPVWWWPDVRKWLESTGREFDVNLSLDDVRPANKHRLISHRRLEEYRQSRDLEEYRRRFGPLLEEGREG